MFRRPSRPLEAALLLLLALASPPGLAARTAPASEPVIGALGTEVRCSTAFTQPWASRRASAG